MAGLIDLGDAEERIQDDTPTPSLLSSSLPQMTAENSGPAVPVGEDASGLAHILGMGISNPDRQVSQEDFHHKFVTTLKFPDKKTEDLSKRISE